MIVFRSSAGVFVNAAPLGDATLLTRYAGYPTRSPMACHPPAK